MYGNIWLRYNYFKIWNLRVQKNLNIEKIAFNAVQMKSLAMHITCKKFVLKKFLCIFDISNIFMESDLYIILA